MAQSVQGASAPTIFNFRSTEVRTLVIDGEVWFVASDVAKALGHGDARHMTRILDDDEQGLQIVETLGGRQELGVINESGLYHAVLKSRKPEAKPFRKWVTAEVLPAIRKTGAYSATAGDMVSKAHALRCFAMTSALTGPAQIVAMNQLLDQGEKELRLGRFLVTFNGETPQVEAVPDDAAVMTMPQFLQALTDGSLSASAADLERFIIAAATSLAQSCAYYEGKAERRAA